jgi:hypothetical protein
MPKAKPVSLHPLNFEEAIGALMRVVPAEKPRKRRRKAKSKKK